MGARTSQAVLCPSAQPRMAGARVFGVIQANAAGTRVAWLERPVPVSEDVLALTHPLPPTQVLRIAAQCQEEACCHFDGKDCQLATRLVQLLPSVTRSLPACQVRPDCRWFLQEGGAACQRCPQIVTYCVDPDEQLSEAATPRC